MMKMMTAVVAGWAMAAASMAAEIRPLATVDVDTLTGDTQVVAKGAGDRHIAIAWWMPRELWGSILARDANASESDRQALLAAMDGVSVLAVVQADVSALGAFNYYSKDDIETTMTLSFTDAEGREHRLPILQKVNPDLEIVLGIMRPVLAGAMGNMGQNMHFYVIDERTRGTSRLLDPYRQGQLDVRLSRKDGHLMDAVVEMPVNALFVPRMCPNGKEAHISWKYCPWDGSRLE